MEEHKSLGCFGRPVLLKTSEQYKTGELDGTPAYIAIPIDGGYIGSKTYFHGEDKITTSCGIIEYDAYSVTNPEIENEIDDITKYHSGMSVCKTYWTHFIQASDEELLKHLEDPKVDDKFRILATYLINNIKIQ